MLTYTISISTHSTLLRYSLVLSEYLSNHSTCPDTRPDTINTRPRRRPSVKLKTYRPGNEARLYHADSIENIGARDAFPIPFLYYLWLKCYVTFVSLPYKAMRRLGKHTTYEFQTHVELDAPSVMCS